MSTAMQTAMRREEEVQAIEEAVQSGRVVQLPNVKTWEEMCMPSQNLLGNYSVLSYGGYQMKRLGNHGFSRTQVFLFMAIAILFTVAMYSVLGYVVAHFIKKFW
jgi:hypothetical protein